jgi:hypothetical protein
MVGGTRLGHRKETSAAATWPHKNQNGRHAHKCSGTRQCESSQRTLSQLNASMLLMHRRIQLEQLLRRGMGSTVPATRKGEGN